MVLYWTLNNLLQLVMQQLLIRISMSKSATVVLTICLRLYDIGKLVNVILFMVDILRDAISAAGHVACLQESCAMVRRR